MTCAFPLALLAAAAVDDGAGVAAGGGEGGPPSRMARCASAAAASPSGSGWLRSAATPVANDALAELPMLVAAT